jgi:membrane protease YdiL (CAAX protease family)
MATTAGLCIALGWPFVTMALRHGRLEYISNVRGDIRVLVTEWALTLVLAAIVVFWERRPAGSVGLRMPSWRDLGAMALVLLAMYLFAALVASVIVLLAHLPPTALRTSIGGAAKLPILLKIAIPVTAGICEEFLFRGYALERIMEISGSRSFAAITTIGIFTLAHIPRYGLSWGLVLVAIIATALTTLYLWRRNLPAVIAMHVLIDGIAILAAR